MLSVKRIFVEKKSGFDVEAQNVLADFRENLALDKLEKVRIALRYDVEDIDEADFQAACSSVFSEPAVDNVYLEKLPVGAGEEVFAVEYLPGQYDQKADSAAQCVQLLTKKERPTVATAKLYLLSGDISPEEMEKIKNYVINPVDSREARLGKPETLKMKLKVPDHVATVDGFIKMTKEQIALYCQQNNFAMTAEDLLFTQDYFAKQGRNPTITELKVIDTYWSDHCRHTTFQTKLTDVDFEEGPVGARVREVYEDYLRAREFVYGEKNREKSVTLMDMATIYVKEAKKRGLLSNLDESEEINACSIKHTVKTDKGEQDYLIMFKNETHNHPTEIEPFGGAATCLGGAIRDPLAGRSYVYQAMRVTGSGDPRERAQDTMQYKLPQRKITREAAAGYSSYGNQIGLATGLVNEIYHEGYKAKRMEIGAVIGAAPSKNVRRERPATGDLILLIGGRTGRDGCGGATGSSKAHDEKSIEECGAEVQKGNPLTERKLQRLFRDPEFSTLIKRCNDFGAGGVCVAIGELSESLDVDLDKVPKKYEGLDGTELAISESQERMAVVVDADNADKVIGLADGENLEATIVAKVTDTGRMRFTWKGKTIVDIEREFLNTNGAAQYAKAIVANGESSGLFDEKVSGSLKEQMAALLGDLNICSQKGLTERFDSTIGAGTVTMPLGGKTQMTPIQAMCALVPVLGAQTKDATVMSFGFDPYLMEQSPFHGAVYAIITSIAKLVAVGGDYRQAWLTLQEYFERLEDIPEKWGKPVAALLGAWFAERGMGVAAIGGKDSMSGTFRDLCVPPTLCSFAVCMSDADHIITPEFKAAGSRLYLLDIDLDELCLPIFDDVKRKYELLHKLMRQGIVRSAYAVERGGVLAAAIKMGLGNGIGVCFEKSVVLKQLTRKKYGAVLVETGEELSEADGFELLGALTAAPDISVQGESLSLSDCKKAYTAPLEKIFPTKAKEAEMPETGLFTERRVMHPGIRVAKPRVVIPVFPGTNCEYDSAKAFEKAGAVAETVIIRNLSAAAIEESIAKLTRMINNAQIVMIPGGFSGGDEPDGSGKFIATTFRNPAVSQAVMELLQKRDGLMLGICNGFQALIKLGLVPYGEIRDMREDSPTLTFNTIGRHMSRLVNTRITSCNSPWLSKMKPGDVYRIAVSHGEGRFVGTEKEIGQLFANGQVATQYSTEDGTPSMDIDVNPNGSMYAVEGLLSPDGRVFGKMCHSERYTDGLYKNVPGEKKQDIFSAGVEYFK